MPKVSISYQVSCSLQFVKKYTGYIIPNTKYRKPFGFSLVELLVVIAVIGILVVVASVAYGNVREKARDSQRKQELKAVATALLLYYQDYGEYPTCPSGCTSESGNWIPGLVPDYIKSLPKDPNQAGLFPMLANIFKKQRLNEGQLQPQVAAAGSVDVRVNSGTNDAEQRLDTNAIDITSSDLELTQDPASSNQEVGMRFTIVNIPVGATITNAYIEFETDEVTSGATSLTVWGEANDSPAAFSTTTGNITSRTKTSASVAWSNVPAWSIVSEKHQTPNISSVIQQIVSRPGWASGNSIVIIITGSGSRVAEAYEGEAANAPLLHVDYTTADASPSPTPTPTPTPSPSPSPSPTPTPTPTPVPTPTPSPTPSPTPPPPSPSSSPAPSSNIYNYVVAPDKKSFVLWAVLEKSNDPEAWGNSQATCSQSLPDPNPKGYNYCIESPQ